MAWGALAGGMAGHARPHAAPATTTMLLCGHPPCPPGSDSRTALHLNWSSFQAGIGQLTAAVGVPSVVAAGGSAGPTKLQGEKMRSVVVLPMETRAVCAPYSSGPPRTSRPPNR